MSEKSIMKSKLIGDFFEADEVGRQITKGVIDMETGVEVLRDLIKYVRRDIKIMDDDAFKRLELVIKELNDKNKERKDQIKASEKQPDDVIDERNQARKLLLEDLKRYKQELDSILEIGYKKGWFD